MSSFAFSAQYNEYYMPMVHIVADALYCNYEIIRMLNTYGVSYILNYSYLASTHKSMGIFSMYYHFLSMVGNKVKSRYSPQSDVYQIEYFAKKLIGMTSVLDMDPYYHFDLARQYYQKAHDLHSEGKIYKEINREMYTLDDDFNDDLTHFCAAIERYRINKGSTRDLHDKILDNISDSKLFQYKYYINEHA